jgi:NAD(P)H dehydrogenase (quinone)
MALLTATPPRQRSASSSALAPRILVILGHPKTESFCGAIAQTYAESARLAGAQVRQLALGQLNFDPCLHLRPDQSLEPDLLAAQQDVLWANQLVFVYPNWWGTMPALMKGFFDRAFTAGFAFKYHSQKAGWEQLLKGRSAHLIVTMDTPPWYYRWVYNMPGHNQMKRTILGFCGVAPIRITEFGILRTSTREQRDRWLAQIRRLAHQTGAGGR